VQFQPFGNEVGHRQQLHVVAQLPGVTHVGHLDRIDPGAGDLPPVDAGTEGQVGQDGQLLRGVAAVNVHRRIGLGVAASLGFGHSGGIVGALLIHLVEDEIARAIEDRVELQDLVRGEAFADGRDNRDPAGHRGLERNRAAQCTRSIEQLRPVLGQQGLVGGDHVLAAFEQPQHDRPSRFQPPDKLRHGRDFRVVDDAGKIVGEQSAGQVHIPRPGRIGVNDPGQFERFPGVSGDPLATFQQQPRDSRPDRSQADDGNLGTLHDAVVPRTATTTESPMLG